MGRKIVNPELELKPGTVFGRLTVLEYAGLNKAGLHQWRCACSCGRITTPLTYNLTRGLSKSCGCISTERAAKLNVIHGMSKSPEHKVWLKMRSRCLSPTDRGWPHYGGRGITIDPRWDSFSQFYADMGPRPSPKHSIERIDNNAGYSPENCMWVTFKTQARNKRNIPLYEYEGHKRCAAEWAEITGINADAIAIRISKLGWSVEKALTTPIRVTKPSAKAK